MARYFAHYREELLRPFDEIRVDYKAIGDARVEADLRRILVALRGEP